MIAAYWTGVYRNGDAMRGRRAIVLTIIGVSLVACSVARKTPAAKTADPSGNLPAHIRQLTAFGERADWSHDGKRILFLSKTFGDAMEIDVATKTIRNLTAHYPHHGYTRALYLANGDI